MGRGDSVDTPNLLHLLDDNIGYKLLEVAVFLHAHKAHGIFPLAREAQHPCYFFTKLW